MKTLLVPFLGNSKEFERVQLIVVPVKLVEIVKLFNYNLKQIINNSSYLLIICLRGVIIDNILDTVINFRVKLCWLDLNSLNVIPLLQKFIKSTHYQFMTVSVLDNDWLQLVKEIITLPCLSFSERIAMYLSKQQVIQLFDKLIENFSGSLFAFDSVS